MTLWPCDDHMEAWWEWRKEILAKPRKKRKSEDEADAPEPKACRCGPEASRELCGEFFEATSNLWPMLWKDRRLRATVAACVEAQHMQPIELDRLPATSAYRLFFQIANGSAWTNVPQGVDEYYRYMRMKLLHTDRKRTLKDLVGWHSLASVPAGALAVILNDIAYQCQDAGKSCLICSGRGPI
jgi:hypothetical protein